jgi:hypothetical protein
LSGSGVAEFDDLITPFAAVDSTSPLELGDNFNNFASALGVLAAFSRSRCKFFSL